MANWIECIETPEEYSRALEEVERLREADPDSEEGRYRDSLLKLIAKHEARGKPRYDQPT